MDLGIQGKKALVTGAGRGIGQAISLELAKEGAKVAVVSRTEGDIRSLVEEMGGITKGHYGAVMDLVPEGAPQKFAEKLQQEFGPVDILVHNLGDTLNITDPLCSMQDWQKVWRINVGVAIELNLLLLPQMQKQKWGRVVHIGSTSSMENNGPVTYCTAKAALVAYSRSMGRVLAPQGIVMTSIIVGAIFTKGGYWDKALVDRPKHVEKYITERLPLHRFGKVEDIAHMVAFLSSERADFCQGAVIPVEGGQSRHYFGQ